jgi:peptide/nickel transport system substrate-binding protein
MWNAAERIFIDQAPIDFIAQIQPTTAFRTDVKGITWRSDQWIDWSQASKS